MLTPRLGVRAQEGEAAASLLPAWVGAATLSVLLMLLGSPPLLLAALLSALLLLAALPGAWARTCSLAAGLALIAVPILGLAIGFAGELRRPPEFDFAAFWYHARLAARGVDFYDPDRVRELLSALGASPAFVDLGRFWYPPQTMLLFLPLGWVDDPRTAWYAWSALQLLAAVASTLLLLRVYVRSRDPLAVVVGAATVAALAATTTTFRHGQTSFVVLALLLWFAAESGRLRGGLALGLAILVKPIALLVAIGPVLRARWRAITALALTAAVATALAWVVFGTELVTRYAMRGAGPVPLELFRMPSNQSLLGLLARRGWIATGVSPLASPLYLAAALVLVVAAAAILLRRRREDPALELAFLLAVALVVYPQTLDHYAVLLLPAIVWLSRSRSAGARTVAIVTPLLVALAPSAGGLPPVLLASSLCAGATAWRLLGSEGEGDRGSASGVD